MDSDRRMQIWLGAIFLVVIVVITIAAAFFSSGQQAPNTSTFKSTTTSAITATDWTKGKAGAKVSVIEYGDFQCPACGAYEPLVQQLEKEYGDRVQFVFRNFPLPQHANAVISAEAAGAAGAQGKFWEMHDLLYTKQSEWSDVATADIVAKFFDGYAQSLGLDLTKFHADITSNAVTAKIQNDKNMADAASVDHTPTFFINLAQIQNPNNYAEFKSALDAALATTTGQ